MIKKYLIFAVQHPGVLALVFLSLPVMADRSKAQIEETVVAAASSWAPTMVWDANSLLDVDINCDGKTDYVVMGQNEERVAVALLIGPISKSSYVHYKDFVVGSGAEDVICKLPITLELDTLDYDNEDEDIKELPGFRTSTRCLTFALTDDGCGTLHFYWNHGAKSLSSWRRQSQ